MISHHDLAVPGFAPGWELMPRDGVSVAMAFGSVGQDREPTAVWRVATPGPIGVGEDLVAARASSLVAAERARAAAGDRLREFAASVAAPVSFAMRPAVLDGAEAELAFLVGLPPSGVTPAEFGLSDELGRVWRRVTERFSAAMQRVEALLGSGLVETVIAGEVVARSVVRWDGDVATAWRRGPSGELASLHRRSVGVAQAARAHLVSTLETVLRGALLIASLPALAANPVGLLIAIPSVWSFIDRLMTDTDDP